MIIEDMPDEAYDLVDTIAREEGPDHREQILVGGAKLLRALREEQP